MFDDPYIKGLEDEDMGASSAEGVFSETFLQMLSGFLRATREDQFAKGQATPAEEDDLPLLSWRSRISHILDTTFEALLAEQQGKTVEPGQWEAWTVAHAGIIETMTLLATLLQSRARVMTKQLLDDPPAKAEEQEGQTWVDYFVRGNPPSWER